MRSVMARTAVTCDGPIRLMALAGKAVPSAARAVCWKAGTESAAENRVAVARSFRRDGSMSALPRSISSSTVSTERAPSADEAGTSPASSCVTGLPSRAESASRISGLTSGFGGVPAIQCATAVRS